MTKEIVVTAAIIVKESKVMAARRKPGMHLAGYWEFPGGKLEEGETPEHCLARELKEELNITTRVGSFVGESVYDYGTKIVRLIAYMVEHISGEFKLIDHDEIRWLAVDELFSVEWAPADIPLVDTLKSNISTQAFYDKRATEYCDESINFKVDELYKPFIELLPRGARILDLGCGSGRDSRAFLNYGYSVTALDGCKKIASYAEKIIGQPVMVEKFQNITYEEEFDGVWACASLLHSPKNQLPEVLRRLVKALKINGAGYMSFKWGEQDIIDDNGRFFNNHTEESITHLISTVSGLKIMDLWVTTTKLRNSEQKWINALVKKGF